MTKRLQAVSRNAAPDALPQNVNATNSTRALFCKDICALCAHSWLGELPPCGQLRRESALNENQLTAGENCGMCVNTLIKKKKCTLADISRQNSIQVCIRFGFDDRVTVAGFCFQAPAIKNCNHSSGVTNQVARL